MASVTDPSAVCKPLRQDAERNRGRIVEAAQDAFAERGLDVSLEHVAARAGVGIGTLYRRFPERDELISACFERRLNEYVQVAEDALQAPDGWTGFSQYVERICEMQAKDRGFQDVMTTSFPRARGLEEIRSRGFELFTRIVDRAKSEGSLRPDFVAEDHLLLLMGNAGVIARTNKEAPDAWRRYVALMLDGLRNGGQAPLPDPPSPRQMVRAMLRTSEGRRRKESRT
jgi:AcrR family transcriptional regulator